MNKVRLLYGSTEPGHENLSTNLLWRSGFRAPDTFFAVEFSDGKVVLLVSDLEYERAKKESRSDCEVEILNSVFDGVKVEGERPSEATALMEFLKKHSVSKVVVPANTPVFIYQRLSESGFDMEIWDPKKSFYPQREIKTEEEIGYISDVQHVVEEVVHEVVEILTRARISRDGTLKDPRKGQVTAESVRNFMNRRFVELNCLATSTIIACGDQAVDPHCDGYGPLYANLPIVMDVYPRSSQNWYWSDMSRTFFKGEPSLEASEMYQAVLTAQNMGIGMIHADVDGLTIQTAVQEFFESKGYKTGIQDGTMQGFFHGVGHGVGLEIHEEPRISRTSSILQEGSLVTVEPGLYYLGIGGVRIEDLVVVTKDGCRNLTTFPKELKDMIIP